MPGIASLIFRVAKKFGRIHLQGKLKNWYDFRSCRTMFAFINKSKSKLNMKWQTAFNYIILLWKQNIKLYVLTLFNLIFRTTFNFAEHLSLVHKK